MYADDTWPSVSMGIDLFKRRRVKSRYNVEFTKDNLPCCSVLMKIDELRLCKELKVTLLLVRE
jgi:hypothetical protein